MSTILLSRSIEGLCSTGSIGHINSAHRKGTLAKSLTQIASGEFIWGSRSKKGKLLSTNAGKRLKKLLIQKHLL
jgi:hypothetical protein